MRTALLFLLPLLPFQAAPLSQPFPPGVQVRADPDAPRDIEGIYVFHELTTDEPPLAPPKVAPPTVADIMATRAEIAKLVAKEAAQVADLNAELKKLGIPPVEAMGIGKPGKQGPPGKDGHSPVLTWGTGADFDRIAIDGVFSGPHLTGPPGSPAPLPVDPFDKVVSDAFQATPDAEKPLAATLVSLFKQSLPYVDTDADTGVLFARMIKARRTVVADTQLLALRQATDRPILDLLGPNAQLFTPELRAKTKVVFQRNIDALGKVVR